MMPDGSDWTTTARPRYGARVATYPRGATFGPRHLNNFELVWLLSGSARWQFEAGMGSSPVVADVTPGMALLARPGGSDSYTWSESEESSHAYLHFTADIDPETLGGLSLHRSAQPGSLLGELCQHLLDLSNRDSDTTPETCRTLVLLLDVFLAENRQADRHPLPPGPVMKAIHYVRSRWEHGDLRPPPLAELATVSRVSSAHLSRLFASCYGMGIAAALEVIRLGHAAIDLQRSNLTLSAVARRSGFADAYHLSRRFSRVYGSPPGRFRRAARDADALAPIAEHGLLPLWNALLTDPRH